MNINNTGGVTPSVNWTVLVSFTVANGVTFNGGNLTHTFTGAFTNNGTVTSSGTIRFAPAVMVPVKLSGTDFTSTGTVDFSGSGLIIFTGTPTSLQDVIISNANTAGITPISAWNVNGNFTISSNAKYNAGSYSHIVGGNLTSNGTLNGETSTFTLTSGTCLLNGSPETEFNHLVITGTTFANTAFKVTGNFSNNGTFDGSNGTLVMSGGNNTFIDGTTSPTAIQHLIINKSGGASVL
ncbi:MAG: hypothetical protein HC867_06785 [Bacteroidia bacterium]|nr:hypothetical protein [Bacteroidia bacterium]